MVGSVEDFANDSHREEQRPRSTGDDAGDSLSTGVGRSAIVNDVCSGNSNEGVGCDVEDHVEVEWLF